MAKIIKRTSRESAVPAYDLSPWQRYICTEQWKLRKFYDVGGILHFVIPFSIKDTLIENPPKGFTFTETECLPPSLILRWFDEFTQERFYLCEIARIEKVSLEVVNQDLLDSGIVPKKPRIEKPPKTARLRAAIGNKQASGKRERFPVVQVSKDFAFIEDLDDKPPPGYRPSGAIGKIVTERGVQYIYPKGFKYSGQGDKIYEDVSQDRGSYDVRTLRKGRTTPGKVNSRRLVPLGEGRTSLRGKRGKFATILNAIGRAFIRGGGKYDN